MKKILFIDHSFHKKTLATKFLIDILCEVGKVDIVWDDSWQTKQSFKLNRSITSKYDVVIFFQRIPSPISLLSIDRAKSIFWFPMYDESGQKGVGYFKSYAIVPNLRIVSFSKCLHERMIISGLYSTYFKYHPKPINRCNSQKINILFWPRNESLSWSLIKSLLFNTPVSNLYFKVDPDPSKKVEMPTKNDIKKYNIHIIRGWLDKKEYLSLLQKCTVFIAPRLYEGIGQSFLNAIVHGLIVVAPDKPTMNEYIIDNVNGILFDRDNPKPINLSSLNKLQDNSFRIADSSYDEWLSQIAIMKKLILSTPNSSKLKSPFSILKRFILISNWYYCFWLKKTVYRLQIINAKYRIWKRK